MPLVTYGSLKDTYDTYEWDAKVGLHGGFVYTKFNKEIDVKPIKIDNISIIIKCDKNIVYPKKENVSGLNKTNVELENIPLGSLYGWDHSNNAWIYYINDIPTYYSNYVL